MIDGTTYLVMDSMIEFNDYYHFHMNHIIRQFDFNPVLIHCQTLSGPLPQSGSPAREARGAAAAAPTWKWAATSGNLYIEVIHILNAIKLMKT